jgi:cation:H+ antiporter
LIDLIVQLLILIGSLSLLGVASHFTILNLEKIIEKTGFSEVSAGFIILSILTSSPEVIIGLFSVLQGEVGISIGDIIGSNVFNIGLVVGFLGFLGYLGKCCTKLWVELSDVLFLTSLLPLLLVISHLHIVEIPSFIIGAVLLGFFFVNNYIISKNKTPPVNLDEVKTRKGLKINKDLIKMLIGLGGIIIASRLVVSSSIDIAVLLGVPSILVGAKIVSIGTSLPELTVSLIAVRRGRVQLALGNLIGSNLTNLTLVLGLILLISPFAIDMTIFIEILPFLLVTTLFFWRFLLRGEITKKGGIILLATYVLFQVLVV